MPGRGCKSAGDPDQRFALVFSWGETFREKGFVKYASPSFMFPKKSTQKFIPFGTRSGWKRCKTRDLEMLPDLPKNPGNSFVFISWFWRSKTISTERGSGGSCGCN